MKEFVMRASRGFVTMVTLVALLSSGGGLSASAAHGDDPTKVATSSSTGGSGPIYTGPATPPEGAEVTVIVEKAGGYEIPTGPEGTKISGIDRPVIGMTPDERERADRNAAGKGDKGGDKSEGADKKKFVPQVFINPNAGKKNAKGSVNIDIIEEQPNGTTVDKGTRGVKVLRDLLKYLHVHTALLIIDGKVTGLSFYWDADKAVPTQYWSEQTFTNALFAVTGGSFEKCATYARSGASGAEAGVHCTPLESYKVVGGPPDLRFLTGVEWTSLDLTGRDPGYLPDVPMCAGVVKDGGLGLQTRISVADVGCLSSPESAPVRLEIEQVYADTTVVGAPYVDSSTGEIVYQATEAAQGQYVAMKVWAIGPDTWECVQTYVDGLAQPGCTSQLQSGVTSFPFMVYVRNRYAPTVQAPAPVNAVRGVETVIPASSLFADRDVDEFLAQSGDRLTPEIVSEPGYGNAFFNAAGDLVYQPFGGLEGKHTDQVVVRTFDVFGLPSPDLTIPIQVGDVVPNCANEGTVTGSTVPVRILLHCWLTPPPGWTQLKGLEHRIVTPPEHGTLSDFDPVAGVVIYTPDPAHPGPVTFTFEADNNGATRTGQHTINVLP